MYLSSHALDPSLMKCLLVLVLRESENCSVSIYILTSAYLGALESHCNSSICEKNGGFTPMLYMHIYNFFFIFIYIFEVLRKIMIFFFEVRNCHN